MNSLLATVITGMVTDENANSYFIQKDGLTFALDKKEGQHKIGDDQGLCLYRHASKSTLDNC